MRTKAVSEQARKLAARSTKEILRRRGSDLGMHIGCGFPKSGTVWLCQLLGTSLGVPYPREYRSPVAMASIIHAHWRFDPRFPRSAYIRRDGRDVMLSLYFYYVRALDISAKPARARDLREMFTRIYGSSFDPADVRGNLPRFVETQLAKPRGSDGLSWHQHVEDWWDRPGVAHVSYEELLSQPVEAVRRVTGQLTGEGSETIAALAVERWSFATTSKRSSGDEDRSSFLRKGIAGDWANYFSQEAGEIFDGIAGQTLLELEYVDNREWFRSL